MYLNPIGWNTSKDLRVLFCFWKFKNFALYLSYKSFSLMTKAQVKMMIEMSDPDFVYTMLLDQELDDLADWVADEYF
jgi:hypothetical protein